MTSNQRVLSIFDILGPIMIGPSSNHTVFAVADMALVGIQSIIPPDEVIDALRNIQTLMPMELKDTMLGGLGITKTAKRLKKEWLEKIK